MEEKNSDLTEIGPMSDLLSKDTISPSTKTIDSHTRPFIAQTEVKGRSNVSRCLRPHITENCIIVWLDSNINEFDKDYQYSIAQLRCITKSINIFIDIDKCIDFIIETKDEKIFMIISSHLAYNIVSLIHDIPQLDSIYIFCAHQFKNEQWTNEWKKVKGVFNEIELIGDLLKRYIRRSDMNYIPFTVLSPTESFETSNLDELDRSFMYSQLLKEIFLEIEDDHETKQAFLEFWRLEYSGNSSMLKIIDKFEHEYDRSCSIKWYTKEYFIYSTVNRALRELEIDVIMKMRFFIRDLHRQIEQLYTESSDIQNTLTLYRGQCILNAEFNKIRNSKGGLLSFNSFLSTSTDRYVSLLFANSTENNSDLTTVLFRLEIHGMNNTYPYASVRNISHYEYEEEILFSMNTIFRIGDVAHIEGRLFEIHLTLTNDNDSQLKILTDHIRQEIGGGTGWHRLGNMMLRLGEYEKAEELYETLLHSIQDDNQKEMAHLYHQLGFIKKEKGDFMTALSYLQKTVAIEKQYFSHDNPALAITYNRIGSIYYTMTEYQTALSYYQKALDIQKQSLPSYHSDVALTYSNIGDIYHSKGDYSAALSFYQMTLKTQQECLPPNDPSLATTYNCIGIVHEDIGDYDAALSFYDKALHIEQKFLPLNHPSIGSTYSTIAGVHYKMGHYSTALSLCEKALQIQQKCYSTDHISLATTYGMIGGVYQAMGEYSNALTFYEKSLEIRQKCLPPHHLDFLLSYTNLGTIYDSMGDYANALLFYQKALEIQETNPGFNNSQLSTIYNNLGAVYQSMEDYPTALSYFQKTLELEENSFSPNYPVLATIYNNIGLIHDLMKDYAKALAFYQKAVKIKQQFLPPNHISLAKTYNNIGDVYRSTGNYSTALKYLQKTLAIEQNCLSLDHPDLAITYNNIAKVFTGLHKYHSAKEYAEKAVNIARHALGPMHPDVKMFQDNLNKILQEL